MRMKKWKKILIWAASIIVIIGVGGIFAANYAVDKVISTLSADLEDDLLNDEAVVAGTDTEHQDTDQVVKDDQTSVDTEITATETDKNTDKPEHVDKNTTSNDSEEFKDQDKSDEGYSAEVSVDKAKNLQGKITVSEKAQVSSVLLNELNMSDIKELQALANGGLNLEEKKQARSIILDKLSAEQYDELIQVAKKYGMSKGKLYEEIINEK